MTRRRLLLLTALAVPLLAGGLWLTWEIHWRPGVTEVNCRRVCMSMTLAEVQAILGGAPTKAESRGPGRGGSCIWSAAEGFALVLTRDHDKRVAIVAWYPNEPRPPTFAERARSWLGW